MFPGRDRRRLKKIERQLTSDDPDFAHRMATPTALAKLIRWMTFWRALGTLAAVLAALALLLGQVVGFLIAALTAALLLIYAARR